MNNKYYKQLGKRTPRFYNFPQMFKWQWRQRFLRETSMVKKNSVYTVQKVSISISRFYLAHLWILDQIVETLFSTGVTSENKTIHTPPPIPSPQCWGGCCFVQVAGTVAQHCVEGVGWEKLCFPLFKLAKYREALWCKVFQLNLSLIVDQYKLIPCILHQKINFFIVSSFPAAAHIYVFFYMHCYVISYCKKKRKTFHIRIDDYYYITVSLEKDV